MIEYTPSDFVAVTPSDTTELMGSGMLGLLVGGAGTLVIQGRSNTSASIPVQAGQIIPGRIKRVMAATTATSIVALYL